ncbi:MAG: D-2-hydroxyacid dehydrogenase [Ilumatobacteraceae bacterium]
MTAAAGPPALLCTNFILERYGDRVAAAAPHLQPIALNDGDVLDEADLARLRVAFFSADAWPDQAAHFMGAVVRAPALDWLHTFSVGTDHPVFTDLLDRGVRVSTSSGASAGPIARTVMLYLLALSRDLPRLVRAQAAHEWAPRSYDDLEGRTVGVVGMGPIGLEVIRMSGALGMRTIGMRRAVVGDEPCTTWTLDRLPELASIADALVIALPLTDDTRGLISAEVISRMRPDAIFINVGRGELVDEPALTAALADGRLGGAGLDVFATEPLPSDSTLWDLPNVLVTPHMSGTCPTSDERAVEIFLANLSAFARDEQLLNER